MSFLTTIADLFVPRIDPLQTRESDFASLEEQLAAIRAGQALARPWRQAGVNEALGVPAILSAVSLISGTVGSLSMEAFTNGELVRDQNKVPRLIQRPNPKTTPRAFYRDSAYYLATRGEAWWWVAQRDVDGNPISLVPVPPWEIIVERNDRDRYDPTIRWLNRTMPNADMRQITYLPSTDGLRGVGPLQLAGAAVSVTVEADAWAANFFAGNLPSIIGTTDQDLDADDLKVLDAQWLEKAGNLPRWMTQGMTLTEAPYDASKAQLTETRAHQVGEVARQFLIPGPLLEYQMSGQSLTYRNEADIWTDFQRRCLSPHYLEPIEQEMSDLLTRSTMGRFSLDQLLRADVKTRFDVYGIGIDKGIFGPEYPQQREGILPGSVDFAPVPFSPPQADPGPVPFTGQLQAGDFRCAKCHKMAFRELSGSVSGNCQRCGEPYAFSQEPEHRELAPMQMEIKATPAPIVNVAAAESPHITVEAAPAPNVDVKPAEVNIYHEKVKGYDVIRDEGGKIIRLEKIA